MDDSIGIDYFFIGFLVQGLVSKKISDRIDILFAFPSWVTLFNSSMFVSCFQEDDNCCSNAARIHLCPLNILEE